MSEQSRPLIPVSRLVLGLAFGLVTYLAFGLYADFVKLGDAVASFQWAVLVPVLGLSVVNYGLRWMRWHWLLRIAGEDVEPGLSLGVFGSGLAMSITPGKLGEVIKVGFLKSAAGVSGTRSFPVVVTERLQDLFAVLALAAVGVLHLGLHPEILLGGILLTGVFFVLLATGPGTRMLFRVAGALLRRHITPEQAQEAAGIQSRLLKGRALWGGMALGLCAWLSECLGLWLVVRGFGQGALDVAAATFMYAIGTLAGALSFLPGGLVATEASLAGMLSPAVSGALPDEAAAIAATLLIRVATLWFAVALGVVALVWTQRRLGRPMGIQNDLGDNQVH